MRQIILHGKISTAVLNPHYFSPLPATRAPCFEAQVGIVASFTRGVGPPDPVVGVLFSEHPVAGPTGVSAANQPPYNQYGGDGLGGAKGAGSGSRAHLASYGRWKFQRQNSTAQNLHPPDCAGSRSGIVRQPAGRNQQEQPMAAAPLIAALACLGLAQLVYQADVQKRLSQQIRAGRTASIISSLSLNLNRPSPSISLRLSLPDLLVLF